MVILDLEVINCYGNFQDLVLNLLDNNILAVDKNKNITGSEMNCVCPALDRRIERMGGCCNDLLTVDENMNKFIGLVNVPRFSQRSRCLNRGKIENVHFITNFSELISKVYINYGRGTRT